MPLFGGGSVAASALTGTTLAAGVVNSSLQTVGVLASPHMTSPVVDSGGIAVTGNSTITGTLGGVTTLTATTVIAALTGNASTATALATPRTINGVSFDGSANITISAAADASLLTGTTMAANVVTSSLTAVGILAGPHMTTPVVDSGGLTVTAGGLTVTAGGGTITAGNFGIGVAAAVSVALSVVGSGTSNGSSDCDLNGTMAPTANSALFRGLRIRSTVTAGAKTATTGYGIDCEPTFTQGAGNYTTQAGIFINPTFAASGAQHAILVNAGCVTTAASVTGSAGLNIPPGTAPTSPNNGDMWTTTSALLIRLNGVTKTVTVT